MDSSSFPHGAEDNRDGVDENVDEREEDELDAPASGSRNKRKGKQRTNVAKRCKAQEQWRIMTNANVIIVEE